MYFRCENRVPDGLTMLYDHIDSLFDGLRPSRWSLVLGQQDIILGQQDILLGQQDILLGQEHISSWPITYIIFLDIPLLTS